MTFLRLAFGHQPSVCGSGKIAEQRRRALGVGHAHASSAFVTVTLELVLPLTEITLSLEAQLCTHRF